MKMLLIDDVRLLHVIVISLGVESMLGHKSRYFVENFFRFK